MDAGALEELADQLGRLWMSWASASDEVGRSFAAMSSRVAWSGAATSTVTDVKDEQHQLYAEAERAWRPAGDAADEFIGVFRAWQRSIDDELCERRTAVIKLGQAQQELAALRQVEVVSAAKRNVTSSDERLLSTVHALQTKDAWLSMESHVATHQPGTDALPNTPRTASRKGVS